MEAADDLPDGGVDDGQVLETPGDEADAEAEAEVAPALAIENRIPPALTAVVEDHIDGVAADRERHLSDNLMAGRPHYKFLSLSKVSRKC